MMHTLKCLSVPKIEAHSLRLLDWLDSRNWYSIKIIETNKGLIPYFLIIRA